MLSAKVRRKLDTLSELPSVPTVISSVLNEIENVNYNAKHIASLIEQDQGLTAKILRVANSPFYGLTRTISTVDLAIVILGSNIIKEILIGLLMQRIFQKTDSKVFNTKAFWKYTIFCGSTSRYVARKLKYKLVSEAFVTGLMHDIGLLVLMDKFRNNFAKVRRLQSVEKMSLIEAEMAVFECTHSDIGAWIAEKWNFPQKIIKALEFHHIHFFIADEEDYSDEFILNPKINQLKYPLTSIVSIAEWLAFECGIKEWDKGNTEPSYYISNEFLMQMVDEEIIKPDAALTIIKQGVMDDFEKVSISFN